MKSIRLNILMTLFVACALSLAGVACETNSRPDSITPPVTGGDSGGEEATDEQGGGQGGGEGTQKPGEDEPQPTPLPHVDEMAEGKLGSDEEREACVAFIASIGEANLVSKSLKIAPKVSIPEREQKDLPAVICEPGTLAVAGNKDITIDCSGSLAYEDESIAAEPTEKVKNSVEETYNVAGYRQDDKMCILADVDSKTTAAESVIIGIVKPDEEVTSEMTSLSAQYAYYVVNGTEGKAHKDDKKEEIQGQLTFTLEASEASDDEDDDEEDEDPEDEDDEDDEDDDADDEGGSDE